MKYPVDYITNEVVKKTNYKSIIDGYDRDYFSVIKRGNVFWVEGRGCPDRTYKLLVKETKRIFPELIYLYDIKTI